MKKLPYIPDKDLYAAVMFACKMVRENGYFNKDCGIAADYYDVDVDEVKRYVRIAQGRGQKQANKRKPKVKYKWYAVYYVIDFLADNDFGNYQADDCTIEELVEKAKVEIKRATNMDNVEKAILHSQNYERGWGTYLQDAFKILEFDTKKQAEQFIRETSDEEVTEWIKEHWPNNH